MERATHTACNHWSRCEDSRQAEIRSAFAWTDRFAPEYSTGWMRVVVSVMASADFGGGMEEKDHTMNSILSLPLEET